MLWFSFYATYQDFTFQRPSDSSNNESLLLLFDGLQKVMAKYIVLCLMASAKFQNVKGASYQPALMGNTRLLLTCISRINPVDEQLLVSSTCYTGQDMLWREAPLEKNVYLKSIKANVLKSVIIMTQRGESIQTDQIGTQCLDALFMLLKDYYRSSYLNIILSNKLKSPVQAAKYSFDVFLCFISDDLEHQGFKSLWW